MNNEMSFSQSRFRYFVGLLTHSSINHWLIHLCPKCFLYKAHVVTFTRDQSHFQSGLNRHGYVKTLLIFLRNVLLKDI